MTLAELGAVLRQAREEQQKSLADVADYLKIPARILAGIEEGSDRVPRTVYVYHFIKDYARYLGFSASDVTGWLDGMEDFRTIIHPVMTESSPYTSVKPSILPSLLSGVFKIILLAAIVCGGYMAYLQFFAGRDYGDSIPVPPTTSQSAVIPQEWDTPDKNLDKQHTQQAENSEQKTPGESSTPEASHETAERVQESAMPSAEQNTPVPAAPVAVTNTQLSEQAAGSAVSTEPSSPAAASPEASSSVAVLPEGMHQVEVIADSGDCWMGFEPDGQKQQRTLRKGDTFSMTFRDTLILRLGHALAVRIIYDGKELERSSSPRVVTMTFPPQQ